MYVIYGVLLFLFVFFVRSSSVNVFVFYFLLSYGRQDCDDVAVTAVAKPRPGRAAAKNRKPIVDTISDEEEDDAE